MLENRNKIQILAGLFLALIITAGCQEEGDPGSLGRVTASAGDDKLTLPALQRRLIQSPYVKDSAFNAKRTIESWAVESLFYQEALDELRNDELQIEEQVNDYRKTLVGYIYENRLVENLLDTVVTNDEIEAYYRTNRNSFVLRENIVKVDYVKVPMKSLAIDRISKALNAKGEKDQLAGLLAQHAENFFFNDSTWLYIEDVRKEVPQLRDEPDFVFHPGRTFEFRDSDYYYYLKIKDVKTKNALSPLHFERPNIRKFILNNRKTKLISSYKQELLEKAKKEKRFVIY